MEWTQKKTLSEETRRTSGGHGSSIAPRQNVVDIETIVSLSVVRASRVKRPGLNGIGEAAIVLVT